MGCIHTKKARLERELEAWQGLYVSHLKKGALRQAIAVKRKQIAILDELHDILDHIELTGAPVGSKKNFFKVDLQ